MNINNIMQDFYFYIYILLSLYCIDTGPKNFISGVRKFKI